MLRRGLTQKKKTLTYTHSMKNSLLFSFHPDDKGEKAAADKNQMRKCASWLQKGTKHI